MTENISYYDYIDNLKKQLKKKLPLKRYLHSEGVSYTAASLAMIYNCDLKKAIIAGLLHDCAKKFTNEELLKKASKYNYNITEAEIDNPSLLHAKIGVYIAKNDYGIEDDEILNAIKWHTTGKPDMTLLEKIIFVADFIEPYRKEIPNLPDIRKIAFNNIDKAIVLEAQSTIEHLNNNKCKIDEMTLSTLNYYQKLFEV